MITSSAFPLLPITWHSLAKECMQDMTTASAMSQSHLQVHMYEEKPGELSIELTVIRSLLENFDDLIFRISKKAIDAASNLYVSNSLILRDHFMNRSLWWSHGNIYSIQDAVVYAYKNERALRHARELNARHESGISREFLAKVDVLFANHAINQILNVK